MDEANEAEDPMGYWVISGSELLALLRRCHGGEDPDHVYITEYANSDVSFPGSGVSVASTSTDSPARIRIRYYSRMLLWGFGAASAYEILRFVAGRTLFQGGFRVRLGQCHSVFEAIWARWGLWKTRC